jgi:anti-sigma factor RsiW
MSELNCEQVRDHIDEYLDGSLDAGTRAGLEAHGAGCVRCARELRLAHRVHAELRALPALAAPGGVVDAAAQAAARTPRVVTSPVRATQRRWISVVAAAFVLVAAATWLNIDHRRTPEPEFTAAEVRRAREELALAFVYVDRYSSRAADLLRDDVLERRVVPRVERALASSGEAAIHDALVPGLRRVIGDTTRDVTSPTPERS